ncbi:MAG: hypothetical protein V7642_5075, partial [Burkholderiales bacterium]
MARHVASTRIVPQANRLGLASHSQAESALALGTHRLDFTSIIVVPGPGAASV